MLLRPIFWILIVLFFIIFIFGFFRTILRTDWTSLAAICVMPLLAVGFGFVGCLIGETMALIAFRSQLKTALVDFRSGKMPNDENIEVVSENPEVAAYKFYFPGFAAPGFTNLIVLDESGRFAELAKVGRVEELAETPEIKARDYEAFCAMTPTRWIGDLYVAQLYDVDGCFRASRK